jgi:hypothetical protein
VRAFDRFAFVCCVFIFSTLATVAFSQSLAPLERALESAGYHIYNPPRSNWGPGFVFEGDVLNGRFSNAHEVCSRLYAELAAPNKAKVVLASHEANDIFGLRLAFNYLKKIFGFANDDSDLVRIEQQRTAEVAWGDIWEMSYTRMDKWLESGEPRPVNKQCRSAIDELKAQKRFNGRVFVILRAVAPDRLNFNFERDFQAQAGASAKLGAQIEAGIKGKGEFKDRTHLEISEPLFVGYASPIAITDWLPTGEESGEIVSVRGRNSDLLLE